LVTDILPEGFDHHRELKTALRREDGSSIQGYARIDESDMIKPVQNVTSF
jgi:hypothetical protein